MNYKYQSGHKIKTGSFTAQKCLMNTDCSKVQCCYYIPVYTTVSEGQRVIIHTVLFLILHSIQCV